MPKKKRKHHYLPRFYVGGFTNAQGEVFVLDHQTGKISRQSKNGTFHLPYFYSVDFSKYDKRDTRSSDKIKKTLGLPDVDTENIKEHPDMIEDLLGDSENLAARIIPKLVSRVHISDLEKIELSTFIALMYTRTPAFRDFTTNLEKEMVEKHMKEIFSSREKAENIYNEMIKDGYEKKVNIEDVLDFYKTKRYKVEIPKELNIKNMLLLTPVIDRLLYEKTWFVIEAPEDTSFVTSDLPVFLYHYDMNKGASPGFATPGVKVFFPLSQRYVLVMEDTRRGKAIVFSKVDKAEVRKLNEIIFANSGKYVISRAEALLIKLMK